jgi:CubicO group peptidase (beta-lactamase class C family)
MMSVSPTGRNLRRGVPEQAGIASTVVLQFVEALASQIHEIHSFMLLRHGTVIAEGWWSPYAAEHPHMLFSLSKSFTSTAVGLAVAEGHFSIDDLVMSFFPEETALEVSEGLATMRVRHLLSMSTGQSVDTWSTMVDRADGNWIRGFLEVPVHHTPGTHFVYNTGATYMLSAIVQRTTGLKLVDFLQPRLFAPLAIDDAYWRDSAQGISAGGIGLSLKTEDIAKFGQLYLQKGLWEGRSILPEAWIEEATAAQVSNSNGAQVDWAQGYGYQFWRCRHGAYRGDGVFGQYCVVMPEQDAVLAMTSGIDIFDMQQPLNLIWDILLPAMTPEALPEDTAAYDRLSRKLSALSLAPVEGRAGSPLAAQVSQRIYRVDDNTLSIKTIAFDYDAAGCTLHIRTTMGEEVIPCGYGEWQRGRTNRLFQQSLLFDRAAITSSGAWTADDTFTLIVRLYETPFYHTLACHFMGDELLLDVQINVSLESLQPLLLVGHSA